MPRYVASSFVVASLLVSATTAGAGGGSTSALEWTPCSGGFECTTLDVPVDYADPGGDQVALALIRHRATDAERRIGSLIVNYGGPGDPGTETLRLAFRALPLEVQARFDVVSFDPRGAGRSRPIDCIDDATFDRAWSEDVTPDDPSELPAYYDGTAYSIDLIGECVDRLGDWLARVGTRNGARDLDRIRAALRDDELTYLGFSYGTVLGSVYAQEFPRRVRALVLDSAVDLSTTLEERQDANVLGFEAALDAFLADCAMRSDCPYHSDGEPRAALLRLRDELEDGRTLRAADGRRVGATELYVGMLAALYSESAWDDLAEALRMADRDGDGTVLRVLNDLYSGRRDDGSYNNIQEAIGVITCADQPVDRVTFDEFQARFEELTDSYPVFGSAFGAAPLGCDPRLPRPRVDEQLGDVRTSEAPPILIVSVTDDPVTPHAGAVDLHRRLRRSRVLTLEGTRHGAYASGSPCIDTAVDDYLVNLKLPSRRARCEA